MSETLREHLNPKQTKAIAALITTRTVEAAAAEVGVTSRTLRRWMAEDALFQVEYRHARRAALDEAIASMQVGAIEAVEALRSALSERSVNVRIRAAAILLEHALAANMQFNLDERLRALEEASGETVAW